MLVAGVWEFMRGYLGQILDVVVACACALAVARR